MRVALWPSPAEPSASGAGVCCVVSSLARRALLAPQTPAKPTSAACPARAFPTDADARRWFGATDVNRMPLQAPLTGVDMQGPDHIPEADAGELDAARGILNGVLLGVLAWTALGLLSWLA